MSRFPVSRRDALASLTTLGIVGGMGTGSASAETDKNNTVHRSLTSQHLCQSARPPAPWGRDRDASGYAIRNLCGLATQTHGIIKNFAGKGLAIDSMGDLNINFANTNLADRYLIWDTNEQNLDFAGPAEWSQNTISDGTNPSSNTVGSTGAVVAGGVDNEATGNYSTSSGGRDNVADGKYSTSPGGRNNVADGNYSFAAGRGADTNGFDGTFVWSGSGIGTAQATATNEVRFKTDSRFTIEDGDLQLDGNGSASAIEDGTGTEHLELNPGPPTELELLQTLDVQSNAIKRVTTLRGDGSNSITLDGNGQEIDVTEQLDVQSNAIKRVTTLRGDGSNSITLDGNGQEIVFSGGNVDLNGNLLDDNTGPILLGNDLNANGSTITDNTGGNLTLNSSGGNVELDSGSNFDLNGNRIQSPSSISIDFDTDQSSGAGSFSVTQDDGNDTLLSVFAGGTTRIQPGTSGSVGSASNLALELGNGGAGFFVSGGEVVARDEAGNTTTLT